MDVTKVKILDVQTQNSVKNVKSLKTQIRELKEQLGQLEKGTEEYNRVAKQLADTTQKQTEIQEAAKYNNKDFGATMSNLTRVATGVIGAFNGISAAMQMMGADSEDAAEALKNIQLTMAIIQGLSAVDTARKSLEGLINAFSDLGKAKEQENLLQKEIQETKTARDAETVSENLNADAKQTNAGVTKEAAAAEGKLNAVMTGSEPIFKKVGSAIKGIGKTIVGLVSANPILFSIAAVIGAISAALVIYTKNAKRANAEAKLMADMEADVNHQFDEQLVRLNTLVSTLDDHNSSMAEKKKVIEELNKIIPDYNGKLNETTGEYTANGKALQDYIDKLYVKLQLEVYESKIKEYLQQELEIQQKLNKLNNDGWTGWHRFWGQISKAEGDLQEVNSRIYEMTKLIKGLDLTQALDENKITKNTGKTLKEIAKEIKAIYQALIETIYDEREFKKIFNGVYNEAEALADKIDRLIVSKNLGGKLTESFLNDVKNKKNPLIENYKVTLDYLFGDGVVEGLEEKLKQAEAEVSKYMQDVADKKKRISDKELASKKETVEALKFELDAMKDLAQAAQDYADYIDKDRDKKREELEAEKRFTAELEIEKEYIDDVRSGNLYVDVNKAINESENELKNLEATLDVLVEKWNKVKKVYDSGLESKKVIDDYNNLLNEIQKTEQAIQKQQLKVDDAHYKERLKKLEIYFKEQEALLEQEKTKLEAPNTFIGILKGLSGQDNTLDILKLQEQQLEEQKKYVDKYYTDLQSKVIKGDDEWVRLEKEKNAAILELDKELENQRAEIQKEGYTSRINAIKSYYNALATITGQVQSLLDEEMAGMDENSAEYKKYKLINAKIDVASGVLAAFMSGIESGVPWPYNLFVAAAMAGLVGVTGAKQLENIENEQAKNSMSSASASPVVIGGEYDTLSYMQNADILSSIQNQRVYVTEQDITSTQHRVQVTETSATF